MSEAWDKVLLRGWAVVGECWETRANRTARGYGQVQIGRTTIMAHRLSYEASNGPIPVGLVVRHKCDNPPCVNPAHLEVGTQRDNEQDKIARGRRPMGSSAPQAKLTEEDVLLIRKRVRAGESKRGLGREFGVSEKLIRRIAKGEIWRTPAARVGRGEG